MKYDPKNTCYKWTALLCLWLFVTALYAMNEPLRSISRKDGLLDLTITSFYKDLRGYVWIGTASSLERFDGMYVKHYPAEGGDLKWVYKITETQGNQLWVASETGLWTLKKHTEQLTRFRPEELHIGVRDILPMPDGSLYIGSENGLFIWQNGRMEHVLPNSDLLSTTADNLITALAVDNDGHLWILTQTSLFFMDLKSRKLTECPCNEGHIFRSMSHIGRTLFLGTMNHGLVSFDTGTKRYKHSLTDLGSDVILSLSSNGKDRLYVGTDGGGAYILSAYNMKKLRSFRMGQEQDDLRSNAVYSFMIDRDSLMWIGYYQVGIDYTPHRRHIFSTYSYPPFNSKGMAVRAVAVVGKERMVGTRNGLYYIDEGRGVVKNFHIPQMRSNMVLSICPYKGKYYIGTYGGGAYMFDPSTLSLSDFAPNGLESPVLTTGHVFRIKSDTEDNLWLATSQGIICCHDSRLVRHFTSDNSQLPSGLAFDLCFDENRNGWICTQGGLCIWDHYTKTLRTDLFPKGFRHKGWIGIAFRDTSNKLYFLFKDKTLIHTNSTMTQFREMKLDETLREKTLANITEDAEGWLWFCTNDGIYRYDKKKRIICYSMNDGLPGQVFTSCPPVRDGSGRIWFGNVEGLCYVDQKDCKQQPAPHYPLTVTDILTNGTPYMGGIIQEGKTFKVRMEPNQRNITIRFSSMEYTDPTYTSYQYRIDGRDTTWIPLEGYPELACYDLPVGTTTLHLRCIDHPDSETTLLITVPFAWQQIGWILPAVALLLAVYLFRKKSQQKKTHPKEEKYKKSSVSEAECIRLATTLEQLMLTQRPYTNPYLKLSELAAMLHTSPYTLSYLFNQYLHKNYYDYLNQYRIEEFKRLAAKEEYARYTLSALAGQCGFSSSSSFFRSFKKAEGITPNEYVRQLGKNN